MKYISGNLDIPSQETIKNALVGGTGDTIEKKIPHIMTGDDENTDYLGECIFKLYYDISESGTYTLFLNNILPEKVFLNGEEVDPNTNTANLLEGEYTVEIYSKRYWEEINEILFNNLPGLKKVEFPRPLKRFGLGSIQNCSNLETLVFEKNVEDLIYPTTGGYFLNCPLINEIQVSERNKIFQVKDKKYLISRENNELYLSLDGTIGDIKILHKNFNPSCEFENLIIPDSVEIIGEGAFEGCSFAGSLTFGMGLKRIQEKAFYNINIEELESIEFKTTEPPTIDGSQYFDLRELDGNGNPISGIEIEDFYLPEAVSENWRSWSQYFAYFSGPRFQYFTLEAVESCAFSIEVGMGFVNPAQNTSLSYSLDDGTTWTTTQFPTSQGTNQVITITTPTIQAGGKVLLKGVMRHITIAYNTGGYSTWSENSGHFNFSTNSKKFNISGNILSLFYGDNYLGHETFPNTPVPSNISSSIKDGGNLCCLFKNNVDLYSTANLFLPLKLTEYCCAYMFQGCTSLVHPPKKLSARALEKNCYRNMFFGCSALIKTPNILATILNDYCCYQMFAGCNSLTTTFKLPATKLKTGCYNRMFYGCTSLVTAPELPAIKLGNYCYAGMFKGCTSLTSAPELPATTLANYCYGTWESGTELGMFSDCTSLVQAPQLPATTLASDCYRFMFSGCTALQTAPELPATTLGTHCYAGMFKDCTALTTAPAILPAVDIKSNCYSQMFQNCTSLEIAPILPATLLKDQCYKQMFQGCSNLNYIKALLLNTMYNSSNCTENWVSGVSNSGTFITNRIDTLPLSGSNYYPSGWTQTLEPWPENYNYFTTEAIDSCIFTLNLANGLSSVLHGDLHYIEYSIDGGSTWTRTNYSGTASTITTPTIQAGGKVFWRADARILSSSLNTSTSYSHFSSTGRYKISGKLDSLIGGNDPYGLYNKVGTFMGLFLNSINLVDAGNLILPEDGGKVASCYSYMFKNCTSLTTAPTLPTKDALNFSCYSNLFYGCTNLGYIKVLATSYNQPQMNNSDISENWIYGVAPTGTFIRAKNSIYNMINDNSIPSGWTVQTASS